MNEKEGQSGEHGMQQIRLPTGDALAFDATKPPEVRASLPELDLTDDDIIEGLEFRDATPRADISLTLTLSLDDRQRPLPVQVGKFVSDTLGSIIKAAKLGNFGVGGSSSRREPDGRNTPIDHSFTLGIQGDPTPAIHLVRATLWWLGAPENTTLREWPKDRAKDAKHRDFPLELGKEPVTAASHFLQLAIPTVARFKLSDGPSYRIDRVPFSTGQREGIRRILTEVGAAETTDGWVEVATNDGGRMTAFIKYLDDAEDFAALNILVDTLTPAISELVHKLMRECAFMLMPMVFAASEEVARTIDCDWPKATVVAAATKLHKLLVSGPYDWWKRCEGIRP